MAVYGATGRLDGSSSVVSFAELFARTRLGDAKRHALPWAFLAIPKVISYLVSLAHRG
jgi:hypothetical protein